MDIHVIQNRINADFQYVFMFYLVVVLPFAVLDLTDWFCRFQQADTRIPEHVSASYVQRADYG